MSGWGRVGEGQVSQNEECKTDLKAKLKKRRNKNKAKSTGGLCAAFSACAGVLDIFRQR